MRLSIWQKSSFARVVMLLMMVAGTLIGGHNSLSGMRAETAAVFTGGIEGDGVGIQGDLNIREETAYNMTVLAGKYLPPDNGLIQNVLLTREALLQAAGAGEKAAADTSLETAVKDLYDVLNGMALSEQDGRLPNRLYAAFRSAGETISHDPYNQEAADFNKELAAFPANLLGGFTGVKPLELFE